MKIQALAFAAIAAAVASIASVGAAEARPGWVDHGWSGPGNGRAIITVNRRIANQHRRIRRARRQGRLTRGEARRVRFELSHIRGFRRSYWRDGRLNFRERRHLTRLLNRNSRRIQRLASNRRIAPRRQRFSRYNGF
jgi:hypothetical protein